MGITPRIHAPRLEGVFGHPVPLSNGSVVVADERYLRDSILLPESRDRGRDSSPSCPVSRGASPRRNSCN